MRQSDLFQADPIRSDLCEPGVLDANVGDTTKVADRFAALAAADLSDREQDSVIQLALQVLEPRVSYTVMSDPTTSLQYFRLRLAREPREIFLCAFLDTRHRLIEMVELFQGTLDGCSVHPRVVAQEALRRNAAACLIVHNHPSGDPTPSTADVAITKRLSEVLMLFDIRVLDHLVVGRDGAVSLAKEGRI
ncbi:DNA repair protein [Thiohalocapsa marina]|uniref:DNA repair protein n=1 Tax=Thiohalocapsa marina TaxID=424902 RepID=A0A5M8FR96_9GAMM|nr:JAB domain-containing protein [Thiohalocapsa marina]KAA6183702.1 DNA repair protein [Thiohalocapsa marina]